MRGAPGTRGEQIETTAVKCQGYEPRQHYPDERQRRVERVLAEECPVRLTEETAAVCPEVRKSNLLVHPALHLEVDLREDIVRKEKTEEDA